ncbi:MAG: DUF262 domain-containing protein [Fimbriimonas sp.]|nr:DUF262 domain-containing protein [Fimbriimonas sp.]
MSTQRYSVTPHPIETLLTWVKSGEIAIPEIQRPFVWDASKVRNLLDSLYLGYPVGYLIAWRNPNVKLKDGSSSSGKRILIDGQQRITALMAALLGQEVITKDYETTRIRIAFNPQEERFEVSNPAIRKDSAWIEDVATVFAADASLTKLSRQYQERNPHTDIDAIALILEKLKKITNNHVGVIELAEDLDIETVTEIFIRVNSAGVTLSQADFAMSKIAANETYGGNLLRKAIDYFCHLAISPEFFDRVRRLDKGFVESEHFNKIKWLKDANDDIYDPSYTDMLRVAFTSEFRRGKLQDLVALLSGRNFETRQYEEEIAEQSFERLKKGVHGFVNQTHFERFTMILRSAGFITSSLIGGQNAVNFAYIIYLLGRAQSMPANQIEGAVRQWYVFSILRGRYSGNPETQFDFDVRRIESVGLLGYLKSTMEAEMSDSFWVNLLPQELETSSGTSPLFHAYQAAQVVMHDRGFLSSHITVDALLLNRADVHHVHPRDLLKKQGLQRGRYNQIANFVLAQSEINIAIGNKAPEVYFGELREQVNGGALKYGGITDEVVLRANLKAHCIPDSMLDGDVPDYDDFLNARRALMAAKLRTYFERLGEVTT